METRYFTGYLRDLAQQGRHGAWSRGARMLVPYIKKSSDTPRSLRATIASALKRDWINEDGAARLLEILLIIESAWKNTDMTVDVRDARDWRRINNGHMRVNHQEVSREDSPRAFGE